MPAPFKMFRIVCTANDLALVSGSNMPRWAHPPYQMRSPVEWYHRGTWSGSGGAFWRSEETVRRHLQNLCWDWQWHSRPARFPRYADERETWTAAIPGSLDWGRLDLLRVDQFLVTEFTVSKLPAADFMGVAQKEAA